MMWKPGTTLAVLTTALTLAVGCESPDPVAVAHTDQAGIEAETAALVQKIAGMEADSLSADEMAGLVQMREEEKLARDVYRVLGERWGNRVFSNIARSEQAHMDAVLALLTKYAIPDPVGMQGEGEFTSAVLRSLYQDLVARGSVSVTEALTVGALIEDLDIEDLHIMSAQTDNADITLVYGSLMRGSRNHLRSFTRNLNASGVSYVPRYITQEEYDAIITSPMERGRTW